MGELNIAVSKLNVQCVLVAWFLSKPVYLAPLPEKACSHSDNVYMFYQTFVDDFVACPTSITDCQGIGKISSLNCFHCCADLPKRDDRSVSTTLVIFIAVGALSGILLIAVGVPVIIIKVRNRREEDTSPALYDDISIDDSSQSSIDGSSIIVIPSPDESFGRSTDIIRDLDSAEY